MILKAFVDIDDLRAALNSVVPHASDDPELPDFHRVHFLITKENLWVQATDSISAAAAIVSVWDSDLTGSVEDDVFDLTPKSVKEVAGLFRPAKTRDTGHGDLLIEIQDGAVRFTDVSGLFPGKSYEVPTSTAEKAFVNLPRLLGTYLSSPRGLTGPTKPVSGRLLSRFVKAASAYGEPLVIEQSSQRGALVVEVGESFLGVLMPVAPDDEHAQRLQEWRTNWGPRLDPLAALVALQHNTDYQEGKP